jgi:acetyl-CoA synthetase (ADP-forming)
MSRPTTRTLSEADSKALLAGHGVPFPPELLAGTVADAAEAASQVGLPVALKLCGENIAHKTERGLVRLGLASTEAVADAAAELFAAARPEDEATGVLVAPMVTGLRELIAGASRDPQFGPTVLLGLGGVLAEAIGDVAVRLAPIDRLVALDMVDSLGAARLLGPLRGEPAVDRDALADVLVALSDAVVADSRILSIDLNPLVVADGRPVAVDALVELDVSAQPAAVPDTGGEAPSTHDAEHFRALFEPRGVLVAGASTHPGKFGFVSLHNILAAGYEGRVVATNQDRRPAGRGDRPRLHVHTGCRQPRPAASRSGEGDPGGVRHLRRLRRGR